MEPGASVGAPGAVEKLREAESRLLPHRYDQEPLVVDVCRLIGEAVALLDTATSDQPTSETVERLRAIATTATENRGAVTLDYGDRIALYRATDRLVGAEHVRRELAHHAAVRAESAEVRKDLSRRTNELIAMIRSRDAWREFGQHVGECGVCLSAEWCADGKRLHARALSEAV